MARNRRRGRTGNRRKADVYRTSNEFSSMVNGTTYAFDVMGQFKTDFGAVPHESTLGPILYDPNTIGTGTGTNRQYLTIGFIVGPATLDAADLDPVVDANKFWYVRKFTLQNNSNPAGSLWAQQGEQEMYKVKTRRTLKELGDTLWVAVRWDGTGFTAMDVDVLMQVTILYP